MWVFSGAELDLPDDTLAIHAEARPIIRQDYGLGAKVLLHLTIDIQTVSFPDDVCRGNYIDT